MLKFTHAPSWIYGLALALGIGCLGLYPHLRFSAENSQPLYYKSAYDEEYYAVSHHIEGRQAADLTLRMLMAATGKSLPETLVVADFVLPFLAALAAFFLATAVVSTLQGRLLLTCLFIYGESFLGLGSAQVWPMSVQIMLQDLMDWSNVFYVHGASFFSVYRTPEPQTSFVWCFLVLGCLVRVLRSRGSASLTLLAGLHLLAPFFYLPCVLATVMVEGLCFLLLFPDKRTRALSYRLLLALVCAGGAFVAARFPAPAGEAGYVQVVFPSRAPLITLSVVLSLGLSTVQGLRLLRSRPRPADPLDLLCFALCVLPMLLLNQQLVTGRMAMVTPFEASINAILLFLGMALLIGQWTRARAFRPRLVSGALLAGLLLCLAVVVQGEERTYRMWHSYNEQIQAAVRAVDQAGLALGPNVRIDSPDYALLMSVAFLRPQVRPVCLYSSLFGEVFLAGIGTPGFIPPRNNPLAPAVFEHWLRNGLPPAEVESRLHKQADAGAGLDINFFFSMLDSWKPFSMGRTVKSAEMRTWIPEIVAGYSRFWDGCPGLENNTLLFSATPLDHPASPCLDVGLLSKSTVGSTSLFTYLQQTRKP